MQAEDAPRRLTMAITELDIGGAEKAFVQVATGLSQCGWDVQIISLRDRGPLAQPLLDAGLTVHALNCRSLLDWSCVVALRRRLREWHTDVLLTFLHQANLVGRIAGRWAHVPVIVSGIRVADMRQLVAIPERLTRGWVDHYVAVSHAVAADHARLCRVPLERISVIHNGVDVREIEATPAASRSALQWSDHEQIILSVGRLTAQKSPEDLLRAFVELPAELRDGARLVYVGDGPLRAELQQRATELGVADRVSLSGWRGDVISLMKAADVLVLPSRWEGLPNVVLEAMAAGLPVLAADTGGVREMLLGELQEWLFKPGEITSLTQSLQRFLQSSAADRGRQVSLQSVSLQGFTWRAAVSAYDHLLRELWQRRGLR